MKKADKPSVVFINSHPIQYFAPLYRYLQEQGNMKLEVVYFANDSVVGKKDEEFGIPLQWDIPLLEGYGYVFLKNYSLRPNISNRMWGQINLGIIPYLWKKKRSVIIVHGWIYISNILTIIFARLFGHHVTLRAETPLKHELKKPSLQTWLKHAILKLLFAFVHDFLYIGQQNKLFYKKMGVSENHLFYTPYCVDNDRFQRIANSTNKYAARIRLRLPLDKKVILYSGKYITKKNPMDLLKAFKALPTNENCYLVMVGEGILRNEMEKFVFEEKLEEQVMLTGFINQSEIPYYYASADVFVMCSGLGETWGLSVNEAMNFGLPVIVSDMVGCAEDLVIKNITGWIYQGNNVDELCQKLQAFLFLNPNQVKELNKGAFEKVKEFHFDAIEKAILKLSRSVIKREE